MFAANVAAAAGGIIYFLSYVPFFFIVTPYENMSAGAKTACCLDFNLAMSIGMIIIGDAEKTGLALLRHNVNNLFCWPCTIN